MKESRIKKFFSLFSTPVVLIVFGLLLLFTPDSAIALVTKLLGWLLTIAGIALVVDLLMDRAWASVLRWILPVLALSLGGWLLAHPLALADMIGRIVGLLLVIEGGNGLGSCHYGISRVFSVVTLVVGIVLLVMPRTLTQTVIGLCGLVLIVTGVISMLNRIREFRTPKPYVKAHIIDADE